MVKNSSNLNGLVLKMYAKLWKINTSNLNNVYLGIIVVQCTFLLLILQKSSVSKLIIFILI